MGKHKIRVLFFGLLVVLTSCSREDNVVPQTGTNSAAQPVASPPRVLQAVINANASQWLLINPIDGTTIVIGQAGDKIQLLALNDVSGEFYYRDGEQVKKDSWRDPHRMAEYVAPMPPAPYALWVDRDQSDLRALEMRAPAPNEARRMSARPPDARPMWAVLWKLNRNAWVEVDKRSTSWGVDGSVGPAVMDDLRREQGRSARAIQVAGSCKALCDLAPQAELTEELNKKAGAVVPEEWRLLPSAKSRIAFGVALGDTWHPVGPVILVDSSGTLHTVVRQSSQPLNLQVLSDWLLVSPELLPGPAAAINLRSGARRSLPEALTLPVWVE